MTQRRDARSWLPLAGAVPAIVLLMIVLPSALNLPQTPPQQTLEFAPVPPTDDDPPPPDSGDIGSLGLGSSPTGPTGDGDTVSDPGTPPPPTAPPPPPGAEGSRPITKRCVGSPPRQTEDPMSPPCVGYFEGDNGGPTTAGVTANEVVILAYVEYQPISAALACSQDGCDVDQFYDLGKAPEQSNENGYDEREAYWPHVWRVWQRYFTDRYQLYGRQAHIWVHFGSAENSPEGRVADVAAAAEVLDPFAVIADVSVNGQEYAEEWARRGKVVIMTKTSSFDEIGFSEEFFNRYPGQLWDYQPSVEQMADNYASFLCAQVVGHPVSFAGDDSTGESRRLGLLVSGHPNQQNRIDYAAQVRDGLERCGAEIADVQVDQNDGSQQGLNVYDPERDARMAAMQQKDVTTILNLAGGIHYTQSVNRLVPRWRPEWLVQYDNDLAAKTWENPDVFQHSRNFTTWPKAEHGAERPCEGAFLEVDPQGHDWAQAWTVCTTYNNGRMLFTGIQVAGPFLTAHSLDVGMHAIPEIPSGDPRVPACFYQPGDYTCVKDATVQWWDTQATSDRNPEPGCWMSMDGGARYLTGTWPVRDVDAVRDPANDPCNINY